MFFIRDSLSASTTMFGLVSCAWTAGCLIGGVLFARRSPGVTWLIWGVLWTLGGTCVMVLAGATVGNALLLVPLWLVGGAFNGALNLFANVLMGRRVPAAARGRGFAVMGSATQGAGMAGLLLGGLLVDRFDPRLLVAGAAAAGLLAVLCCVPVVRRAVRREQEPVARAVRREQEPVARAVRREQHPAGPAAEAAGAGIASGDERQRPASPGRAHPVPELPADLLGADAVGRVARR